MHHDFGKYEKLIEEVYINSIRSVVVVDDEFPTLDRYLNPQGTWKPNSEDIERVKEILMVCQDRDPSWLVDIHDGIGSVNGADLKAAPYLSQSDLLILDYHLQDDGDRALTILRTLAENDHFNLVVVYTKGFEDTDIDISRVARELLLALSSPQQNLNLHQKSVQKVDKDLEIWEDKEPQISERIKTAFTVDAYLKVLGEEITDWDVFWNSDELAELRSIYDNSDYDAKPNGPLLLKWLVSKKQNDLKNQMAQKDYGPVRWSPINEPTRWIMTDRLFITVIGKTNKPSEIPGKLKEALNAWNPHPHRLLMAKMRSELDERGVVAETKALNKRFLQAAWLEEIIEPDENVREWKLQSSVEKHWESLLGSVNPQIMEFGRKLASFLCSLGKEEGIDIFSNHINPAENRIELLAHLNSYNCSKPVEGMHLTTGHIIELYNNNNKSYWLCATPACDLVPNQKTTGWHKRLGNNMPFKAVKLHSAKEVFGNAAYREVLKKALQEAHRKNFIFLAFEDEIRAFSFTFTGETSIGLSWEQMFASNMGNFNGNDFSLEIKRINTGKGTDSLEFAQSQARVVAQLRYEYALNLLQYIGQSLSRIGLDFVPLKEDDVEKQ